jgi:hypothetical protein
MGEGGLGMGGGWVGDGRGWEGVGRGGGRILWPISCSLQSTFRPAAVRVGRKNKTGELEGGGGGRQDKMCVSREERG